MLVFFGAFGRLLPPGPPLAALRQRDLLMNEKEVR